MNYINFAFPELLIKSRKVRSRRFTMLWLLETLGLEGSKALPIYIGDDRTDEDAFRALSQWGIGILVSEQSLPTASRYSLKNHAEVEEFLAALAGRLVA